MNFPEIRVTNKKGRAVRVIWDPCEEGIPVSDITGMKIIRVRRDITIGYSPEVQVTFRARLVEVEEEA